MKPDSKSQIMGKIETLIGGKPPLMIWVTHGVPVTPVAVKAIVAMLSFVAQSAIPMIFKAKVIPSSSRLGDNSEG